MSFEKTLSRSQYRFNERKRIASLLDEFGALATVAPAPKCQWQFSERIKGGNPGGFSGKSSFQVLVFTDNSDQER
ncbi:hypothetical protein TNCV_3638561 [Trichonephila clavipes]|nr:hypothetical protein TNCV_3638561 [Trichonephila clavipes]